jgi:hypothetical protein
MKIQNWPRSCKETTIQHPDALTITQTARELGKNIRLWSVAFSSSKEGNNIPCPNGQLRNNQPVGEEPPQKPTGGGRTTPMAL